MQRRLHAPSLLRDNVTIESEIKLITPLPGRAGQRSNVMSRCLSVCLSVCTHISRTTLPNFTKFSMDVACGRGSVLLCNCGFVDDVMFPVMGPVAA